MNAHWLKYVAWFNSRAPRERVILAATAVFCIVFGGYTLSIEPALIREQRALNHAQGAPDPNPSFIPRFRH